MNTQKPFYDIPMIFSAPLVIANLEGRKTQTRRIPTAILNKAFEAYQAGRPVRLWQRESVTLSGAYIQYMADNKTSAFIWPHDWKQNSRPSIHMPRIISRFTGLNVEMRKEPVQDISYKDCYSEGMICHIHGTVKHEACTGLKKAFIEIWDSLHANNPKKPGEGWMNNPEVYVLTYTGVNRNIDAGDE